MKNFTKSGVALAAAAFAFATSGAITAPAFADDSGQNVICSGTNSCKGQSDCHSYSNSCKGQNACKGQGWKSMKSQDECRAAGGTVIGKA